MAVEIVRGRLQRVVESIYPMVILFLDKVVGQAPELLNITEKLSLNSRE